MVDLAGEPGVGRRLLGRRVPHEPGDRGGRAARGFAARRDACRQSRVVRVVRLRRERRSARADGAGANQLPRQADARDGRERRDDEDALDADLLPGPGGVEQVEVGGAGRRHVNLVSGLHNPRLLRAVQLAEGICTDDDLMLLGVLGVRGDSGPAARSYED